MCEGTQKIIEHIKKKLEETAGGLLFIKLIKPLIIFIFNIYLFIKLLIINIIKKLIIFIKPSMIKIINFLKLDKLYSRINKFDISELGTRDYIKFTITILISEALKHVELVVVTVCEEHPYGLKVIFILHAGSIYNYIYYFFEFLIFFAGNIYFILCNLIATLLIAAFATLIERKVMSSVQRRRGPNKLGLFGIFQPIADGVKLLLKEIIIPSKADLLIFIFTPIYSFVLSLLLWLFIPFSLSTQLISTPLSLLYILAISNLAVFGIIFSGWSSNSKYSFLGSLRASSQMISYEIAFSVVWVIIILINGNLNMVNLIYFQTEYIINFIPLLPIYFIFFIIILAETNRAPFDLPEAESELVAGYNVEFSGMGFAFLFLAEYSNIACMSAIITIFFFSNDIGINYLNFIYFGLKVTIHIIIFVVIRATLPRFRYDMVMNIMWKKILLFLIIMFFFFFFLKFILIYTEMYLLLI